MKLLLFMVVANELLVALTNALDLLLHVIPIFM